LELGNISPSKYKDLMGLFHQVHLDEAD